jgi:hypothetical protein
MTSGPNGTEGVEDAPNPAVLSVLSVLSGMDSYTSQSSSLSLNPPSSLPGGCTDRTDRSPHGQHPPPLKETTINATSHVQRGPGPPEPEALRTANETASPHPTQAERGSGPAGQPTPGAAALLDPIRAAGPSGIPGLRRRGPHDLHQGHDTRTARGELHHLGLVATFERAAQPGRMPREVTVAVEHIEPGTSLLAVCSGCGRPPKTPPGTRHSCPTGSHPLPTNLMGKGLDVC